MISLLSYHAHLNALYYDQKNLYKIRLYTIYHKIILKDNFILMYLMFAYNEKYK